MNSKTMPTSLRGIANKAAEQKQHRFGDLYRLLNVENLSWSFYRLRKDAASGVDQVTFQEYEKKLDENLADLVDRLKQKRYRAKLVRRKYIPKPGSAKMRPLGIPALEDKVIQVAVANILSAIYGQDFLNCSYGYRKGIGPHDALEDLREELRTGRYHWIVEADIRHQARTGCQSPAPSGCAH
jgi:retron-type reverse transcriptase